MTSNLTKEISTNKPYNETFGLLSAFAMLTIVAGHLGYDVFTVGGLFPYYSFHVPLFMFISGYFYREEAEKNPLQYLGRKIKRLLIPYLIWNFIYGLLALLLRTTGSFTMGETINLRTLFLEPFISGYQFVYNYAAWFVPVLFLVEVMNLVMRLILKRLHLCKEGFILAASLLVGMLVVYLAIGGHVWGLYKMPGRILFLYPCFQMGQFYHQKLEAYDTLNSTIYLSVLFVIQILLHLGCGGLAFSAVWCTGFANGPVVPYLTIMTGIAFWLRISKVLTPVLGQNRFFSYLGRNTYAVMMHHVLAFMVVKAVLAFMARQFGVFPDFDFASYYGNADYYYFVNGSDAFKMVYLAAGIFLPLALQRGIDSIKTKIAR